jgi:hypothetical protein
MICIRAIAVARDGNIVVKSELKAIQSMQSMQIEYVR